MRFTKSDLKSHHYWICRDFYTMRESLILPENHLKCLILIFVITNLHCYNKNCQEDRATDITVNEDDEEEEDEDDE